MTSQDMPSKRRLDRYRAKGVPLHEAAKRGLPVYSDPQGRLYTATGGESFWCTLDNIVATTYSAPRCPKCGCVAAVGEEKLKPATTRVAWVVGYLVIMAHLTYMVYYYGSMPVTAGHDFEMRTFAILWLVVAVAYPIFYAYHYRERPAKVLRCTVCGHAESSTKPPWGAKGWRL